MPARAELLDYATRVFDEFAERIKRLDSAARASSGQALAGSHLLLAVGYAGPLSKSRVLFGPAGRKRSSLSASPLTCPRLATTRSRTRR